MKITREALDEFVEWLAERHDENGMVTVRGSALALQLSILTGLPVERILATLTSHEPHP